MERTTILTKFSTVPDYWTACMTAVRTTTADLSIATVHELLNLASRVYKTYRIGTRTVLVVIEILVFFLIFRLLVLMSVYCKSRSTSLLIKSTFNSIFVSASSAQTRKPIWPNIMTGTRARRGTNSIISQIVLFGAGTANLLKNLG